MRTDRRYTRVRDMLLDEAVPRLSSGGIALCHICQRSVYFAKGFMNLLLGQLEYLATHAKPKGACPSCGSQKLYLIRRFARIRCAECRREWSKRADTAARYGKKPQEWYDRILALQEAGHNPYQISKLMGCYDAKPIYDFFRRFNARKAFSS